MHSVLECHQWKHHVCDEAVWKILNRWKNFWKKEYCLSKSFPKKTSRFFVPLKT